MDVVKPEVELERIPIRWNRISALAFWFGRIFCNEPVSTSSENALERIRIRWNRIGALAFWFGRIFCDEPVSTSSENALGQSVSGSWL